MNPDPPETPDDSEPPPDESLSASIPATDVEPELEPTDDVSELDVADRLAARSDDSSDEAPHAEGVSVEASAGPVARRVESEEALEADGEPSASIDDPSTSPGVDVPTGRNEVDFEAKTMGETPTSQFEATKENGSDELTASEAEEPVVPARRSDRARELVAAGTVRLQRLTSSPQIDLLAERSRKLWKSPIRGPWLTSVFASFLIVGIPVMFITGLVSYAAYDPRFHGNDNTPGKGILGFYLFNWITSPSWIYRVSQGIHVTLGLALTPILLAKLWSVIPKLFEFPPVRSVAHALERASLVLIVGGAGIEFATGLADIQYYYPWKFDFYDVHFFGAWFFIAGFVVHVAIKLPTMVSALRSRSLRRELATPLSETLPEARGDLVAFEPAAPTISRRGVLALVIGSSIAVFLTTAGESIRALHPLALLAPRGRHIGRDPNDFEVNITFKSARIDPVKTGTDWRLRLEGPQTIELSREELLAMPQTTAELPIACVEGWSTVQTWTGVRIADLARHVSARAGSELFVESLEPPGSPYRSTTLGGNQAFDENALLALKVNGADLAPDHGFPARIIVPGAPGVHCTKWVQQMKFLEA